MGPVAIDQSGDTMQRIAPGLCELVGELPGNFSFAVSSAIAPGPSVYFAPALTAPSTLDKQVPSHDMQGTELSTPM